MSVANWGWEPLSSVRVAHASAEAAAQFGLTASAAAERRRALISVDQTVGEFTIVLILKMPESFARVRDSSRFLSLFRICFSGNKCPDLGSIENGARSTSSRSFGTVVAFSCDEGYRLIGEQCRTDRTWSENLPFCEGYCTNFSFFLLRIFSF